MICVASSRPLLKNLSNTWINELHRRVVVIQKQHLCTDSASCVFGYAYLVTMTGAGIVISVAAACYAPSPKSSPAWLGISLTVPIDHRTLRHAAPLPKRSVHASPRYIVTVLQNREGPRCNPPDATYALCIRAPVFRENAKQSIRRTNGNGPALISAGPSPSPRRSRGYRKPYLEGLPVNLTKLAVSKGL